MTDEVRRLPEEVRPLAEQIFERADADGYEVDHPRTVQLLAAVTDHAPVALVSGDCADGDHDHDRGDPCTVIMWGCDACSLTAEGWAGELEGAYLPECVDAPCSVLTTIARRYGVRIAELVDARVEAASGRRGGETCGDAAGAVRTARVDP